MAARLSDLPIESIREILRATELSAGADSVSARLIRRALEQKTAEALDRVCRDIEEGIKADHDALYQAVCESARKVREAIE